MRIGTHVIIVLSCNWSVISDVTLVAAADAVIADKRAFKRNYPVNVHGLRMGSLTKQSLST